MTRAGRSHIVFILDRSGSMLPLTEAAVTAYNDFVFEQSQVPGTATITLVLFNTIMETKCEYTTLSQAPKLNAVTYAPNGLTALLDTVGTWIERTGKYLASTQESERPEHVIFTVFTDGQENASKEYTTKQIKEMIEHQESAYNWNFIFLGAGIDAYAASAPLGISYANTIQTQRSSAGIAKGYNAVSQMVTSYRTGEGDSSCSSDST